VSGRYATRTHRQDKCEFDPNRKGQSHCCVLFLVLRAGHVAAAISHFISFEVGNLIARMRRGSLITVFGMESVIYMPKGFESCL
jgi:hypothetical protein